MLGQEYSIREIADIIKGRTEGPDRNDTISNVATDSRYVAIGPDTLFIALTTSRNDGHLFAINAYDKGVRNFLVSETWPSDLPDDSVLIRVPDVLSSFQDLASHHRKGLTCPVIGITGSNGKTVVKEWLFQLLSHQFNLGRSPKSYNSQIGVPLSLLLFPQGLDMAVVEAGISQPGEMENLREMIRPDMGLITNVHQAHLENFGSAAELAKEKLSLFMDSKTLIYRRDYQDIHSGIAELGLEDMSFSWTFREDLDADIIINLERRDQDSVMQFTWESRQLQFDIPFADEASIENAVHAIVLSLKLGADAEKLAGNCRELQKVAMRLQQIQGINNCTVINDAYTSDLTSLEIALHFLGMQRQHKKRTLVLSDIVQSGIPPDQLYARVNELCRANSIDRMICIGRDIGVHLGQIELPADHFETTSDFIAVLNSYHFLDEAVLLKGARSYEFERIARLLEFKKHETTLDINLSAMIENLGYYRSKLKGGAKIMAMVKAFSYGTGSHEVANVLQSHGVDYLAVAYLDEGIDLRRNGITLPIMVMNPSIGGLPAMTEHRLEPEVYNLPGLQRVDSYTRSSGERIRIHLKIETGMHRLGLEENEVDEVCRILQNNPSIEVASIFSHLVGSDDEELDDFSHSQAARLDEFVDRVKKVQGSDFITHVLNSDGIVRFPEHHRDMVRLGIGLYGISSLEEVRNDLKAVVSLRTVISQIKKLKKGDSVGYSRAFKAGGDMVSATIPIGYADGLSREMGNGKWSVQIASSRAGLIGNVCMDMCMLDVSDIQGLAERDEVIVMDGVKDIYEMARIRRTIPYEVLTSFSERVKRVFYYGE